MTGKNRREKLRLAGEEIKAHTHSANPFTDNWQVPTVQRNKRVDLAKRRIVDEKGQPLDGTLLVPYERDSSRFVKLVHSDLRLLCQLSSTAISVLAYVMHQALPKNSVVWLPFEEGCEWCEFKQPKSFYDGVNELIIYEYLAKTDKRGFYYINPKRFFNGDRRLIKQVFRKPTHNS